MASLEKTLRLNYNWALDRIHTLCQDDSDDSKIDDAYALTQEFDEWLEPENEEHDVLSLEFIGDYY
jgi:hypothetical protein